MKRKKNIFTVRMNINEYQMSYTMKFEVQLKAL